MNLAQKISHENLLKKLHYCPTTGLFHRIRVDGTKSEKPCGSPNDKGYLEIVLEYQTYLLSHLAWFYQTKNWSTQLLDHKDGVRTNNVFDNLRETDSVGNAQNRRGAHKNKLFDLPLGVYTQGNRFYSTIFTKGVRKRLGTFDTPEEAYQAYVTAKRELHPTSTL